MRWIGETTGAYAAHRNVSKPLPSGSAPYISSDSFKLRRSGFKTKARRWNHRLSQEGEGRKCSTLKASAKVADGENIISLGTARPAPQYYPWQSLSIHATDMNCLEPDGIHTETEMFCAKGKGAYDLGLVLNYGYAAGSPQLLRFVTEHIEMIHDPPYDDWQCSMTCGTTSAIEIVFRMLCDRGDTILSEDFTYPGSIEAAKALGINMAGIPMDEIGMLPDELDLKLRQWKSTGGRKPTVLYTIPSGQNPTGSTQTTERRKAIYQVAEKHDLLILEDDPYYFIQLALPQSPQNFEKSICNPSKEQYLDNLPPSYLSMDVTGRVIRLDATSKILAPGLRCGWVTGCRQLIDKFINHTELSTISPGGLSQALICKLLDETWGHAGFIQWLCHLSCQYRQRLKTLVTACELHLPLQICKWTMPSCGMFLWVQIDWHQHPAANFENVSAEVNTSALAIEDRIYASARERGVLVNKGSWFAADPNSTRDVCFRLTFATVDDINLEEAARRFGAALCKEFEIDSSVQSSSSNSPRRDSIMWTSTATT